jgi:hypothetical protein
METQAAQVVAAAQVQHLQQVEQELLIKVSQVVLDKAQVQHAQLVAAVAQVQ